MGENYKIWVKVEIVESDEETTQNQVETDAGQFELVINEAQALSIDDCEQALLRTNYPAIRAALARHLSEISKKSPDRDKFRRHLRKAQVPGGWRGWLL